MLECVWCTFQFVDVHSRVWSGLGSGRKWEQGGSGQRAQSRPTITLDIIIRTLLTLCEKHFVYLK